MKRILLLLIGLLFIQNSFSQVLQFDEKYAIEECVTPFSIVKNNGKLGLWNSNTNQFDIPLDSSFLYFFPEVSCLFKVTKFDSIFCYSIDDYKIDFLFESYQKMKIYRDFSSLTFSKNGNVRTIAKRQSATTEIPDVYGEFGIEILDSVVLVTDYLTRESQADTPLLNLNGEPLTHFNPLNQADEYVYKSRKPGYCKGGVKNRYTGEWIIPPSANLVIKNFLGYVIELTEFDLDSNADNDKSVYRFFDRNGKQLFEDVERDRILKNAQYRNLLVPNVEADSIYPIYPDSNWTDAHLNFGNYYFLSNGKMGVFRINTNDIIQSLVDFVEIPVFMSVEAKTVLDDGLLNFTLINKTVSVEISEGLQVELFSIVGGKSSYTLRIKNQEYDSVYTYFFNYSNVLDSVKTTSFVESNLNKAMNPQTGDYRLMLNQVGLYSFHFIHPHTCVIHNNWLKDFYSKGYSFKSGVYDLKEKTWVVPPMYKEVLVEKEHYKAYKDGFIHDSGVFDLYIRK